MKHDFRYDATKTEDPVIWRCERCGRTVEMSSNDFLAQAQPEDFDETLCIDSDEVALRVRQVLAQDYPEAYDAIRRAYQVWLVRNNGTILDFMTTALFSAIRETQS